MSNRTDRREAERQARKLAYQNLRQQETQPSAVAKPEPEQSNISEAQLAANRANAQLSTGPVSQEGRARSSRNALKHGLSGTTVLLPHEDAAQYQRELDNYLETYQPATDEELRLVQSQNDCVWRLDRIQRLESALLLKGHLEFAGKYEDRAPKERALLIDADSYIKYEKQLRNLNIQEARLRRIMEKDRSELLRLQAIRKREEAAALKSQPKAAQAANGFEYSNPSNPTPAESNQHASSSANATAG